MVIDPTGTFAYIGNDSAASMLISQIDATSGALHSIQTVSPGGGAGLAYTGVSPDGRYVYAGNIRSGGVYVWSRNTTTGLLTAVGAFAVQGGSGADPSTMIVDPLGRFLYAPNGNVPSVSAFAISQTTGALSPVPGAPFPSGAYSTGGAADPTGRFVYVANCRSDTISAYLINPVTGALADVPGSPISLPTNSCPTEIAVDPSGHYVAVANQISNNVTVFNINSSTGVLTQVPGSPFAAGSEALGLAYAVGTAPLVLTPDHGGNAGSVTVQITGSGFQIGATVKLIGLGSDIVGANTSVTTSSSVTTTFNLTDAPVGTRTLTIGNPDGTSLSLPGGFTVQKGGTSQISVSIVGRSQIRLGTGQTYYLAVSNNGPIDSAAGILSLNLPPTLSYTQLTSDGLFLAGTAVQVLSADSGASNVNVLLATSGIPAGSTQYAPIELFDVGTSDFTVTSAWQADQFPSSFDEYLDEHGMGYWGIASNPFAPQCSAQLQTLSSAYTVASAAYSTFQDAREEALEDVAVLAASVGKAAVEAQVVEGLAVTVLGTVVLTALVSEMDACASKFFGETDNQGCLLTLEPHLQAASDGASAYLKTLPKSSPLSAALGSFFEGAGFAISQIDGVGNLNAAVAQQQASFATFKAKFQVYTLALSNYETCAGIRPQSPGTPPGTASITIKGVTSVDPNDKLGPNGVGSGRFIPGSPAVPYFISFENQPSATAPAQTISVMDVLSANVLDLSSVMIGPVVFANQIVTPPSVPLSLAPFTTIVDLRPTVTLLVKINAALNTSTSTLTWNFESLDPVTGLPPTDPTVGFLPPGAEGGVFFTANLKSTLANGTVISNTATIVFDSNAPISTPTWSNTIDNTAPTSHVIALTATQSSLSFPVQWAGTDLGAGVQDYTIYVSDNDAAFSAWLSNTIATQATYVGVAGHTYRFYAIARDLVGNVENAKTLPEASTQIVLNPNPLIVVKSTLSRDSQNNVIVSLTLTNTGGAAAQNALVTVAKIGSVSASSIPNALLTIAAGASVMVPIVFPPTVGGANTATTLTTSGTYTGGSFSFTTRITLP